MIKIFSSSDLLRFMLKLFCHLICWCSQIFSHQMFISLISISYSLKFRIAMKKIIFTKLTSAGNDFVLIDKNLNQSILLTTDLIKSICDRRFGVGADGILTISDCKKNDFEMEFFNPDGSSGMLCGNGARAIIKYAEHSGRLKSSKTIFTFQKKIFSGEILDSETIKFNLNSPIKLKQNFEIEISDKIFTVSFIDTGAHHVVIDIDKNGIESLEEFPVEQFGRAIRESKYFAPLGTNVNFISVKNGIINIRTYERGVEAETLACGTGSVASAIISFLNGKILQPVELKTRSGENLIVSFNYENNEFINVALTGPAKIVFEGNYIIKG